MSCESPWQSPSSMPKEVLMCIFATFLDDRETRGLRDSVRFSHICQYWRHLAISDERFWAQISFRNKNLAELALSRTKADTPLDVSLYEIGTPVQDPEVYAFVRSNWFRIHSLTVHPEDPDQDFPTILQFFVDNPPPDYTLKELDMFSDYYYPEDESEFEDETPPPPPADRKPVSDLLARVETFRSVEKLNLCCVEFPAWSSLYDNLVHLDLYDHRPPISAFDMLDIFRRSPRLRNVKLEFSYGHDVPDASVEIPSIALPDLHKLDLRSKTFDSTVFLLQHIAAPNVRDLYLQVKSDNHGEESMQLLAPLRGSRLLIAVTALDLYDRWDFGIVLCNDKNSANTTASAPRLSIEINGAKWAAQCRAPSFLELFPNVRKASLHSGATGLAPMFRSSCGVDELAVSGDIDTQVFYEMAAGQSFEGVRTLQLCTASFGACAEAGMRALARAKSLSLLRLVPHDHLSYRERRAFMAFGVKHGVWVQWMETNRFGWVKETSRGRPPRAEKPAIPVYYQEYDDDDDDEDKEKDDEDEDDEGMEECARLAGRKRTYASEEEGDESDEEGDEKPQRLSFNMAWLRRKHDGIHEPLFEDVTLPWYSMSRRHSFDDLPNRRWADITNEYGDEGDYSESEVAPDSGGDSMDVD